MKPKTSAVSVLLLAGLLAGALSAEPAWPTPTNEMRPWVYNWWMGNAVDAAGLRRQAENLTSAGFGGAHAIGIYEARDPKHPGTPFLSEEWTRRFNAAVATNAVYGLGTDLSMGCGWCFGGPWITPELGVWSLRRETNPRRLPRNAQILWQGRTADGKQPLILAAVPARTAVKRTAAADRGLMLDPFSPDAMRTHLAPFTKAFDRPGAAKPRAIYHDSFEYYGASWTPKLFEAFRAKRGYDLRAHLPALAGVGDRDEIRRIKHDYRETLSDLQIDTFQLWVDWCRARGIETRNEAHGTPANWLDLYALADIPETEMFNTDRDILVSKFASSPAHLKGTPRVASESCTWIGEHFTSTLGDVKIFLDQLLLSGVTEVFYHGCCYTPADVAWPGWSFYASLEMNPRNPLWHDMDLFNAGLTRCQSLAQTAKPDEDVLIYWPIHDTWRDPDGFAKMMSVHNSSEWFAKTPFGRLARRLWNEGVSFDYISDRQLAKLNKTSHWKTIYIPACETLPLETAKQLARLSKLGWKIVFDGPRPQDVPGWKNAEQERAELRKVLASVGSRVPRDREQVQIRREPFNPSKGLAYRRFKMGRDTLYYVVNQSEKTVSGSYRPSVSIAKAWLMWPLTGKISRSQQESPVVTFSLAAHESVWVWITPQPKGSVPMHQAPSTQHQAPSTQHPAPILGPWTVTPVVGGPSLAWSRVMTNLVTWSRHADGSENPFSGTVRYQTTFVCPKAGWASIDFGDVRDSARLFVNGQLVGGRFMKPYRFNVPSSFLRVGKNELVLEVTNTGANRLRDVDQRKVPWKHFADINVVGRDYRPFNAAKWPLRDAGLLGPVTWRIEPEADARRTVHTAQPGDDLVAVLARIRAARAGSTAPCVLELAPGVYPCARTLELDARDAGLVIRSAPGGRAVLDGGTRVTGFRPFRDGLFVADVSHLACVREPFACYGGIGLARDANRVFDLYRDGCALDVAREPDAGFFTTGAVADAHEFVFACPELEKLGCRGETGLFATGYWRYLWADETFALAAQGPGAWKLAVAEGIPGKSSYRDLRPGMPFFACNSLKFLNRDCEWVLDRAQGKIYVKGAPEAEYVLTTLAGPLLRVRNAADVRVEGLAFRYGRGNGVEAFGCRRFVFRDNLVARFGGTGVVCTGAKDCVLEGNLLRTFGYKAAVLSGGDRATLAPSGCVFADNEVTDTGRLRRTYSHGVAIGGCGVWVVRNYFHDLPSSSICMPGNDHFIASNITERAVLESDDQGGIDVFGSPFFQGNRVVHNVWRDIGRAATGLNAACGKAGVRLDDQVSGFWIYGNRFDNCSGGHFGGVQIHGGRDNDVVNNVFTRCRWAVSFSPWPQARWRQHWYPNCKSPESVDVFSPVWQARYGDLRRLREMGNVNRVTRNLVIGAEALTNGRCDREAVLRENVLLPAGAPVDFAKVPGFEPLPPESALGPRRR